MRPPRGVTPAHTIVTVLGVSAKATNITIAAIAVTSAPAAGTSHWRTRPANTGTQRARAGAQEPQIRELDWQLARGSTKSGNPTRFYFVKLRSYGCNGCACAGWDLRSDERGTFPEEAV